MKMLFLSSAVAGQLPKKCETVSPSVSQAGQREQYYTHGIILSYPTSNVLVMCIILTINQSLFAGLMI